MHLMLFHSVASSIVHDLLAPSLDPTQITRSHVTSDLAGVSATCRPTPVYPEGLSQRQSSWGEMSFRGSSQGIDPHRVLTRRLSSEIVASALCPYDPLASLMSAYSSVPSTAIFPSVPPSTIYPPVPSSTIYHSVPSNTIYPSVPSSTIYPSVPSSAIYGLVPSSTIYSSVPLPSTICLPRLHTGGVLLDQPKATTSESRMESEHLLPVSHPLRLSQANSLPLTNSLAAFDHVGCSSYPLLSSARPSLPSDLDMHFSLDNGGSSRRPALFQSLPALSDSGRTLRSIGDALHDGSPAGVSWKVKDAAVLNRNAAKELEFMSRDVAGDYVRRDKHMDVGYSGLWRPY